MSITLSCNKTPTNNEGLIKVDSLESNVIIKYDSINDTSSYYYSNSYYYRLLVESSKELLKTIVNSNMDLCKYSELIKANQIDSIYMLANIDLQKQIYYDTIFIYCAEGLVNELNLDLNAYNSTCINCGTLDAQLDFAELNWSFFENNLDSIDVLLDPIIFSNGPPCQWANYTVCVAACILTFGEIPPLCILCIWSCACQFCPSPYLHCEIGTIN